MYDLYYQQQQPVRQYDHIKGKTISHTRNSRFVGGRSAKYIAINATKKLATSDNKWKASDMRANKVLNGSIKGPFFNTSLEEEG